jgi:DNA polymerase-1
MNAPLVFFSADFDGLELRTMAQVCINVVGFSRLGEALNGGKDPHMMVAGQVLNAPYDDLVSIVDEAQKPIDERSSEIAYMAKQLAMVGSAEYWAEALARIDDGRQTGKICNFGLGGGMGAEKFVLGARRQYNVNITVARAKELKQIWLNTWPEFRRYFEINSAVARTSKTVRLEFSGIVRGGCSYTQANNTRFQGLGASAAGNATFLLVEACYIPTPCRACDGSIAGCEWCRHINGPGISPMYGARGVNYVHDELIGECRTAYGHEVAHELARIMREGGLPYLRDVPPTAKPQVMSYWSKAAKPRWDKTDLGAPGGKGRLIAWPTSADVKKMKEATAA